jgi:hypothetical protein
METTSDEAHPTRTRRIGSPITMGRIRARGPRVNRPAVDLLTVSAVSGERRLIAPKALNSYTAANGKARTATVAGGGRNEETYITSTVYVRGKRVRLHLHFAEEGGFWVNSPDSRAW